MTLNLSDNNWAKAGLIGTVVIIVLVLWSYLAGGIFLLAYDRYFDEATPLTFVQYWYHYGEIKQVKKWLFIASFASLVVIISPVFFFSRPRKKAFLAMPVLPSAVK